MQEFEFPSKNFVPKIFVSVLLLSSKSTKNSYITTVFDSPKIKNSVPSS